jgi:putative endonuclease
MKDARRQLGEAGEDLAAAALKKQGYKILERNWRSPLGEVDLIATHGPYLVLVEVKTRRNLAFGGPREAVSPAKQAKLRRLAEYYVRQKRLQETPVRFDVVGITMADSGPQVEIIAHAFR